jgi:diguanylate cyclase (GGDEF)-like protein
MNRIPAAGAWIYLALGLGVTVALGLTGADSINALYTFAALQVAVVMFAARRLFALPTSMVLSTSLIGAFFVGSELVASFAGDTTAGKLIASVLVLSGEALLVVGLLVLVRKRRALSVSGVVGDGLILALGTWNVTWVLLVQPMLERTSEPTFVALIDAAYQPLASVIVFLLAVYLLNGSRVTGAMWLVSSAVVLLLVGDLLYALIGAGYVPESATVGTYVIYTAAYFCLGAAFLHPEIDQDSAVNLSRVHDRLQTRLLVTTSALVGPIVVLAISRPQGTADLVVRAVSAAVLAIAVMFRVQDLVRQNVRTQQELLDRARIDELTGLPARPAVVELLHSLALEQWRPDREPTVLLIDVDRFKNINDSLGHDAGDEVLQVIAGRIRQVVPPESTVARLSGDEFLVIDPTTRTMSGAGPLAERIQTVFREPVGVSQGDLFVTASIGVASVHSFNTGPDKVLRDADTAMYRAKDAGRNCVAFFDNSMHERIAHRLAVETALYRALDRRELRLFHQPILDLESGEISGFEALIRWEQADGTIVSPAEFIPIAEDTGTIVPIGAWALLEALTQLRTWVRAGVCSQNATMSVNVSPRQLTDPNLPSIIAEAISRSGVRPDQLWVEITESLMIADPERALYDLQRIRNLGVRIALDDFGTGYSSLSLLQRFPLQRLKIDRSFVRGIAEGAGDRALVRTIVAMGQSLDLDLVAEGVETLAQLRVLQELGCAKAQGYLISRPVPADSMESTVAGLEGPGAIPLLRASRQDDRV